MTRSAANFSSRGRNSISRGLGFSGYRRTAGELFASLRLGFWKEFDRHRAAHGVTHAAPATSPCIDDGLVRRNRVSYGLHDQGHGSAGGINTSGGDAGGVLGVICRRGGQAEFCLCCAITANFQLGHAAGSAERRAMRAREADGFLDLGPYRVVLVGGNGHGSQDSDDRRHDHQLDQRYAGGAAQARRSPRDQYSISHWADHWISPRLTSIRKARCACDHAFGDDSFDDRLVIVILDFVRPLGTSADSLEDYTILEFGFRGVRRVRIGFLTSQLGHAIHRSMHPSQ